MVSVTYDGTDKTFQFHKGTIRTGKLKMFIRVNLYFNSIKVRLELGHYHWWVAHQLFQFHKGTIRTFATGIKRDPITSFQFHKGTIRTELPEWKRIPERSFQFHKGTIRTVGGNTYHVDIYNFNSIKVRLEHLEPGYRCTEAIQFQFHKGTIRTIGWSSSTERSTISIP